MKLLSSTATVIKYFPNNCADKIKVSQKLVVILCTTSGDVLILQRDTLQIIAEREGTTVDLKKE